MGRPEGLRIVDNPSSASNPSSRATDSGRESADESEAQVPCARWATMRDIVPEVLRVSM